MQAKIYEYFALGAKTEVLVVADDKEAALAKDAAIYAGKECYVLPDFRAKRGDDLRAFSGELFAISEALSGFYKSKNKNKLIVSPLRTLLNPLPSAKNLKTREIKFGEKINTDALRAELASFGYQIVDIVQDKGEARISGDIIDIFGVSAERPARILLDFDEIESIKFFDPSTQKSSSEELKSLEITPFLAVLNEQEQEKVAEQIAAMDTHAIVRDFNAFGFWFIDGFEDYFSKFECVLAHEIDLSEIDSEQDLGFISNLKVVPEPKIWRDLDTTFTPELARYHAGKQITILSRAESSFAALGLEISSNLKLQISPLILNIISDTALVVSLNQTAKKRRAKKASLVIDELRAGDFVVHEDYGVGKFAGLELATVLGSKKEFVVILYQGGDRLLLPVEHLAAIDRYIAGSGGIATLDKLGKASFAKIKEKVREKLFAIAAKIIEIAAKRELVSGPRFPSDADYERFKFESGFAYTQDQEKAVKAIARDLNSGKVMDRLLSGDVGFGKTEVAMNAVYLCVKAGYQALFFAPTTLLSAQHYATLKTRFEPFGIDVFRCDRFSSTSQKNALALTRF